ncbi:hypothetical protein AAFF_G00239190 [Aldrovandia affinis]|uniref:Uncharacterized protein n=1 Tax=Aldrovandia affinis TaxID=143900 RepID=A0AAD7REE1_9TELE|nr:hypothetical protein AAFF_G00239190 [Aldrovandia affinis]
MITEPWLQLRERRLHRPDPDRACAFLSTLRRGQETAHYRSQTKLRPSGLENISAPQNSSRDTAEEGGGARRRAGPAFFLAANDVDRLCTAHRLSVPRKSGTRQEYKPHRQKNFSQIHLNQEDRLLV